MSLSTKYAKPEVKWTKDRIQALIERNDAAVERAILAVFALQTADEQTTDHTSHHNKIGFNSTDAPYLSSLAKQILENKYNKPDGKKLSDKQRVAARKLVKKYWKQLLKIAEANTTKAEAPCESECECS